METYNVWQDRGGEYFEALENEVGHGLNLHVTDSLTDFVNTIKNGEISCYASSSEYSPKRLQASIVHSFDIIETMEEISECEFNACWSKELNDYVINGVGCEGSEEHTFFSLPSLANRAFLYIDPKNSVVNVEGYEFLTNYINSKFDSEQYESMKHILLSEPHEPVANLLQDPSHILRMSYFRDLLEYGIPKYLLGLRTPYEKLEGNSISFKADEFDALVESYFPKTKTQAIQTVADENKAFKSAKEILLANPTLEIKKSDFISRFCSDLTVRGSNRVWTAITKEFPHLSKPGRRKKTSHRIETLI